MSSTGFETTFKHAAAIVRAQCGDLPGLETVLEDLEKRAKTDTPDPLQNRELIVEPHIDAQMLDVPQETVERVAAELQKLRILHIWARATCPSEDDEIVVETDSAKIFRQALDTPCPHCGQLHDDLSWDNIETFYAFHFHAKPDTFKFRDFFRRAMPLPGPSKGPSDRWSLRRPFVRLGGLLSGFFAGGPRHLLSR